MGDFFGVILSFPTALFTALLGIVFIYWLTVLIGLLDVDVLDPGSAVDGAIDGAFDAAGDAVADIGSAGDAADAAGDAGDAGDADDAAIGGLARGLQAVGLGGVPLTVSLSILILMCWIASFLGMHLLRAVAPPAWLAHWAGVAAFGTLVGIAAVVLGLVVTAVLVRPMRPVFGLKDAPRRSAFVGQLCMITSGRVTDSFGQAEIEDGGGGLRVEVRCFRPNTLTRGSRAVVYEYNDKTELYHIAPADEALTREGS